MRRVSYLFCIVFCLNSVALAAEVGFTQKDRELLIRMEERLNQVDKRFEQIDKRFEQIDKRFEQIDKRFEQVDKRFEQIELRISELREDMNKRFEQIDKRFEQVDKRFEQVDKRFEFMLQIMMAIVGAFAAIVAVTIGFAIWDRRTMIRPFETTVKKIEREILEDKNRLKNLIEALRQLAKEDQKLANVLRNFTLL